MTTKLLYRELNIAPRKRSTNPHCFLEVEIGGKLAGLGWRGWEWDRVRWAGVGWGGDGDASVSKLLSPTWLAPCPRKGGIA